MTLFTTSIRTYTKHTMIFRKIRKFSFGNEISYENIFTPLRRSRCPYEGDVLGWFYFCKCVHNYWGKRVVELYPFLSSDIDPNASDVARWSDACTYVRIVDKLQVHPTSYLLQEMRHFIQESVKNYIFHLTPMRFELYIEFITKSDQSNQSTFSLQSTKHLFSYRTKARQHIRVQ